MNHEEQIILYAANQLDEAGRLRFEKHLAGCAECQADLRLWKAVAQEISASAAAESAPAQLAEHALAQIRRPAAPRRTSRRVIALLRSQAFLVQREMWPASAAVMALSVITAWVSGHAELLYFIAPLIAAASVSILFGPEHDPAHELALSTPTSSWKLLLARLSIVSAYNTVLALAAMSVLMIASSSALFGTLALGLLAPMAFLSALALLLSLWIGTGNAITVAYIFWLMQYIPYHLLGTWMTSPDWKSFILTYQAFWQSPMLLLALSVPLLLLALWSANRPMFRLSM